MGLRVESETDSEMTQVKRILCRGRTKCRASKYPCRILPHTKCRSAAKRRRQTTRSVTLINTNVLPEQRIYTSHSLPLHNDVVTRTRDDFSSGFWLCNNIPDFTWVLSRCRSLSIRDQPAGIKFCLPHEEILKPIPEVRIALYFVYTLYTPR